MQGFTQLHFTSLEVLAIIEGVQKRLDKKFTVEEIEQGVLKDVLIDEDYDLTRVVSSHHPIGNIVLSQRSNALFKMTD